MNTKVLFSAKSDEWNTPTHVYDDLNREFNFDYDPCPTGGTQGLTTHWGKRCFVNPPYSDVYSFMQMACNEISAGYVEVAVFLVPSRTGSKWWHSFVIPHAKEVRFIRGRLKFGGAKTNAPFDSVIVVFKATHNDPQYITIKRKK